MIWVVVIVAIGVAIGLFARRASRRDRLAGLDPSAPQHVLIADGEPTGPRHSRVLRGTAGDVGSSKSGSASVQRMIWSVLGRFANGGDRLAQAIRSHGIVVFVGPNGSGKSLMAVESLLPILGGVDWTCDNHAHMHNRPIRLHVEACQDGCRRELQQDHEDAPRRLAWVYCHEGLAVLEGCGRGRRLVYSTLPLLDPTTGLEHERYRPLSNIRQLVAVEHAHVLFDEVAGVSDASDSATMPAGLTRWLQQLRKRDVLLFITTPAYDRCSKPIRQVARLVVDARSFFEEPATSGRQWRPRRAMLFRAYDAFSFGNFNKNSGERLRALATCFYWRPAGLAQHSYDTLAQVHALVDVTDTGVCTTCNGSRSRVSCGCPPDVHDLPVEEIEIVETTGPRGGRQRMAIRREHVAANPSAAGSSSGL